MHRIVAIALIALSNATNASVSMQAYELRAAPAANSFQVLAWNIWNGGDEARYAEDEAVKRAKQQAIIDVIRASGAVSAK